MFHINVQLQNSVKNNATILHLVSTFYLFILHLVFSLVIFANAKNIHLCTRYIMSCHTLYDVLGELLVYSIFTKEIIVII